MAKGSKATTEASAAGDKSLVSNGHQEADESAAQLTAEPRDRHRLVYLLFLLHGVGILLPWNSFINAEAYFKDKLKAGGEDTDYYKNFLNYIGLASQLPNLLMCGFNVFFQSTRSTVQTGSVIPKLMAVIAVETAACVFTCGLAVADSSGWPRTFFDLTIVTVVLLNCCNGVYQSSVYGMAALLPIAYSNAVVLGTNICGTLVALVNILCKLASANEPQLTAVSYFTCTTLLLACCFASLLVLPKLRFYRHFQDRLVEIPMTDLGPDSCDEKSALPADATVVTTLPLDGEKSAVQQTLLSNSRRNSDGPEAAAVSGAACDQFTDTARECCACLPGIQSGNTARRYWLRYWLALKDGWVHCLSVWSVFFCTLSCFPVLQSSVEPVTFPRNVAGVTFADIYVFLFFNAFAMAGNVASGFVQCPPPRWLAPAVWCRTLVCIPFFVLCNASPEGRNTGLPVLVRSDAAFILGLVVFAFTSGYFSSLCMMYAPRCVKRPESASLVAMLATFCLVFGIYCGLSFGAVLTNLVRVGGVSANATIVLFNNGSTSV